MQCTTAPSDHIHARSSAGTAPSGNEAHPLPAEREQEARNRPHINNESIKIICSNKILSYILHARLRQRDGAMSERAGPLVGAHHTNHISIATPIIIRSM